MLNIWHIFNTKVQILGFRKKFTDGGSKEKKALRRRKSTEFEAEAHLHCLCSFTHTLRRHMICMCIYALCSIEKYTNKFTRYFYKNAYNWLIEQVFGIRSVVVGGCGGGGQRGERRSVSRSGKGGEVEAEAHSPTSLACTCTSTSSTKSAPLEAQLSAEMDAIKKKMQAMKVAHI